MKKIVTILCVALSIFLGHVFFTVDRDIKNCTDNFIVLLLSVFTYISIYRLSFTKH